MAKSDRVKVEALTPIRVRRERDEDGRPNGRPVRIPIGEKFDLPTDQLQPLLSTGAVRLVNDEPETPHGAGGEPLADAIRRDSLAVSQGAPLSSLRTDEVRANAEAAGLGDQGKDLEAKPGEEAGAGASDEKADSLADAKPPAKKAAATKAEAK